MRQAPGWALACPGTRPAEIIGTLNKEINVALGSTVIQARFADLGGTVFPTSPGEFGKFIVADTEKWAKVVKFAGIKAD
jgi:tripartite-type tricarboxylate transporter receptor subunit TctC